MIFASDDGPEKNCDEFCFLHNSLEPFHSQYYDSEGESDDDCIPELLTEAESRLMGKFEWIIPITYNTTIIFFAEEEKLTISCLPRPTCIFWSPMVERRGFLIVWILLLFFFSAVTVDH